MGDFFSKKKLDFFEYIVLDQTVVSFSRCAFMIGISISTQICTKSYLCIMHMSIKLSKNIFV